MTSVQVDLDELREHFELLEELNELLHQPTHFEAPGYAAGQAAKLYPRVHNAYYKVVWEWLPKEVQDEYTNR